MQVVNELIRQLDSKGLLSVAMLHELRELGFDYDRRRYDDYDDYGDFDDDWEERFRDAARIELEDLEARKQAAIERQVNQRRPQGRRGRDKANRDERFVATLEVHEWPQPLLDLFHELGTHLTREQGADHVNSLLSADEEAVDRAVRATALAYPGALTRIWTTLHADPTPSSLTPGSGPQAGLLELLLEADKSIATGLRYKALLTNDAVRCALRLLGAHRRLLDSLCRLLAALPDDEMGWQLQFNTDPLLYEVAVIVYSARQARRTVGDLLEDTTVRLPEPTLLPDDPFVRGWEFAALAEPVRVLDLMRWCYEKWGAHTQAQLARPDSSRVDVRRLQHVSEGESPGWVDTTQPGWIDTDNAQGPRIVALGWTGAQWSRLTITLNESGGAPRAELDVNGQVRELTPVHQGLALTSLTDLYHRTVNVGTGPTGGLLRIGSSGPQGVEKNWSGGQSRRWDVGVLLGLGLHDFPVLRCPPDWSASRQSEAEGGAVPHV